MNIDGTCVALQSRAPYLCAPTTLPSLECTLPFPPADRNRSHHPSFTDIFLADRSLNYNLDIGNAMGSPYHVSRSVAHLLSCDGASLEFQAISLIAESLAHPQRALLSAYIQQAVDRETAARFFLDDVVGQNKAKVAEFLADWISLLRRSMFSSPFSSYTDNCISTSDRLRESGSVTQTEHMAKR